MTTIGASAAERPLIGHMIVGEVMRRMDTVRSIVFPNGVKFTTEQHLAIAQSQLLEILQYGAPGRALTLEHVYDHFVIALSHLAVARDGLGEWQNGALAEWKWTDGEREMMPRDGYDEPGATEGGKG